MPKVQRHEIAQKCEIDQEGSWAGSTFHRVPGSSAAATSELLERTSRESGDKRRTPKHEAADEKHRADAMPACAAPPSAGAKKKRAPAAQRKRYKWLVEKKERENQTRSKEQALIALKRRGDGPRSTHQRHRTTLRAAGTATELTATRRTPWRRWTS